MRHWAAAGLCLLLAACSRNVGATDEPSASAGVPAPIEVAVADFPSQWLAERVGGEGVRVTRVAPGALAEPDADLVAVIPGLDPVADAAVKTLPDEQVVDLLEDVRQITSPRDDRVKDPYVWFDPVTIGTMAQSLSAALVEASPTQVVAFEYYGLRALSLQGDALSLDQRLQERLNPCRIATLVVEAPVLTYLARAYALNQVPLILWGSRAGSDVTALYYTPDAEPAVRRVAERRGLRAVGVNTLTAEAPQDDLLLGVEEVGMSVAANQDCPYSTPTAGDRPG
jgi:zinc transport system substrate-binding protein